jgi:hypothetical protein
MHAIATQHCASGEHFSVNQRAARQQPVEKPTVPIGPFHHRSDTKAPGRRFSRFLLFFSHFCSFVHSSCRTVSGHFVPQAHRAKMSTTAVRQTKPKASQRPS